MPMDTIEIIHGDFASRLKLQLAPAIRAGFPSPAEEYLNDSIDFNRDIVRHPESTFYGRVKGDSMMDAGICDGDIAVIDRSMEAHDGSIIVAYINNEFTIKRLDLSHKEEGYIELQPANPRYQPIRIDDTDHFEIWGVVAFTIRPWA